MQANRLYPSPVAAATENVFVACWESIRSKLWPILVANWYCWPLINFLNFFYIPLQYRLLFSNIAAVFWNMLMSTLTNS